MSDSWLDNPAAWDTLKVAGQDFPGLANVKAQRKYKLDQKSTGGADGATLTGLGHMPAEVKITVRIWTEAHWAALPDALVRLIPKPRKGRPEPVDVVHPKLKALSIRSLYFTALGSPDDSGVKGVYELQLEAVEYLPVKTGQGSNVANTPHKSVHVEVPVAPGTLPGSSTPTPPDQNPADKGP